MDKIVDFTAYYVLKYPNGQFVGIDQNSGGYPYETEWPGGVQWFSLPEAKRYVKMFKEFSIYKVESISFRKEN